MRVVLNVRAPLLIPTGLVPAGKEAREVSPCRHKNNNCHNKDTTPVRVRVRVTNKVENFKNYNLGIHMTSGLTSVLTFLWHLDVH